MIYYIISGEASGDMHAANLVISLKKKDENAVLRAWGGDKLKELGVTRIIAPCAVGSLREEMEPGDIAIPDQFIDRTKDRASTFYEKDTVAHISTADPFCPELRNIAISEGKNSMPSNHVGNGESAVCPYVSLNIKKLESITD